MSGTPANKNNSASPVAQKAARPRLAIVAIIVGMLCAAGVLLSSRNSGPRPEQPQSPLPGTQSAEAEPLPQSSTTELLQNQAAIATGSGQAFSPQVPQTVAAPPPSPAQAPALTMPHSEPTPYARQLAGSLSTFDASSGPLTPERAAQWKQTLQQLVQQGAAGAAAIREYLEKNTDWVFGADGGKLTGYDSVRKAMFDALGQIGGPEALGVVLGTLQTTADPKEIALLAKNLAQLEPEQHQAEVLTAVHDALAMAADKNLEGADVGPLFEVLQKYGGANAISQLEQATGQWKYYATMALAQLPDGAGIPSLKRMVQDPNGSDAALQMLAQMSAQYPEARAALLDQMRSGKIAPNIWPYLISPLAGDQFQVQDSAFDGTANLARGSEVRTTHISYGNQNVISAPGANLTPAQIDQQMKLVDELMAATSDPAALKALQQSKDQLSRRQQLVNASPTPN